MILWRPPSEGDNLILQATEGCRYNSCTFCSMYKDRAYLARPLADVFADIEQARRVWPEARRVFLADGDAYTLPTDQLEAIARRLAETFPDLQRISAYATPFDLLGKSEDEMRRLKEVKLSLVYLGIETGWDWLLKRIAKGSAKQMEEALARAARAGLKVSATIITGLGGKNFWQGHIDATADLVSRAPPNFLSTLQLGLEPGQDERFFARFGDGFAWQDDAGALGELRRLVERLDPIRPLIFRSNHASNALPLAGTLPKDRAALLTRIDQAIEAGRGVRPAWARGF